MTIVEVKSWMSSWLRHPGAPHLSLEGVALAEILGILIARSHSVIPAQLRLGLKLG